LISTGNYIWIESDGDFRVGERCLKVGEEFDRGTKYMANGKEEKYDI
jgi:hypothetical protein